MPNNFQSLQPFIFTAPTADDLDKAFAVAYRNPLATATTATLTVDSSKVRLVETVSGVTTTTDLAFATYTTLFTLVQAIRRVASGISTPNAPLYPFKVTLKAGYGGETVSTVAFIQFSAANLLTTYANAGYNVLWDTSVLLFRAACASREYQTVDSVDQTKTLTFEEATSQGVLQNYQLDPSYPPPNSPVSNQGRSLPPSLCAWLQSLTVQGTTSGQTGIVRIYICPQDAVGTLVWTRTGLASTTAYLMTGATDWGQDQIVSPANNRIVIEWIATSGAITTTNFSFTSMIGYFNGTVN